MLAGSTETEKWLQAKKELPQVGQVPARAEIRSVRAPYSIS
jgi:hypothetical protein